MSPTLANCWYVHIVHEQLQENLVHEQLQENLVHDQLQENLVHEQLQENLIHEQLQENTNDFQMLPYKASIHKNFCTKTDCPTLVGEWYICRVRENFL